MKHDLTYTVSISIESDNIALVFSGEEVRFVPVNPENASGVRPRHVRLVADIQNLLRTYIKDNR